MVRDGLTISDRPGRTAKQLSFAGMSSKVRRGFLTALTWVRSNARASLVAAEETPIALVRMDFKNTTRLGAVLSGIEQKF